MTYWRKASGAIIANIPEHVTNTVDLPIDESFLPLEENNLTLEIISGNLPKGMRLKNNQIIGTPLEVSIETLYSFVIRANKNKEYEDRTYKIVVSGNDDPNWITPAGSLPIGNNNRYFIIDSSLIDFQLEAEDTDILAGEKLEFYLFNGELPPGLSLTNDGRLVGIINPIKALEKGEYFDLRSDNGFDTYNFDTEIFDYAIPSKAPKKLNRYYQFVVTITDGYVTVNRNFEIYVVGEDFLRADNTIMQVSTGVFSADNTFLRTPIWLTPANLGYKRANNYITLIFDVVDLNTSYGNVSYELLATNDDGSPSKLPYNLQLDATNGEIAGKVPYQKTITREYKFTLRATRKYSNLAEEVYKDKTFTLTILGEVDSYINWITPNSLGTINTNAISLLSIKAETSVSNSILLYNIENGSLPPGLNLSITGEITGSVRTFGEGFYRSSWRPQRIYNLNDIITINSNFYIATQAHLSSSSFDTDILNWKLYTFSKPGITTLDSSNLLFDQNTTIIDRNFSFTAKVRDHYGYSATTKTFNLSIEVADDNIYSNIYAQPFMIEKSREKFKQLLNDYKIFDYSFIYRPTDPNFGLQKKLKMLIYAGIETKEADKYVAALATNTKRKKYKLGEIKTAVAKKPGTQEIIYEVVYVDVIDPQNNYEEYNPTEKHFKIQKKRKVTVDQTSYNYDRFSVELPPPIGIEIQTNDHGEVVHYFDPNFTILSRYGPKYFIDIKPLTVDLHSDISPLPITSNTGNLVQGANEPYRFRPDPENTLKADFAGMTIDGAGKNIRYISNIYHVREEIRKIGITEINFLPLWMRTAQTNSIKNLGYVTAIPLCYCLPGKSKEIYTALQKANINFVDYNFEIDRFIIDTIKGDSEDRYIAFHNYAHNA